MKAKPYRMIDGVYHPCEPAEATYVELHMPGPLPTRMIPVQIRGTRAGTGNWTWNGDTGNPTLRPSISTRMDYGDKNRQTIICHTWVNDGMAQFLDDCSHELAGQTLPLLDVE